MIANPFREVKFSEEFISIYFIDLRKIRNNTLKFQRKMKE
jgi:hypothetical protein